MNEEQKNSLATFVDDQDTECTIKVIGVGGGGTNAVNHMYRQGIKGVEFYICNTDKQALQSSPIQNKIVLGNIGAGGNPEIARNAAKTHAESIKRVFEQNTDMAFLTACLGGGTGTGASPVVAETIKEIRKEGSDIKDILVVAVVTLPFSWEGNKKHIMAEACVQELRKHADSVIVINNDKLRTFGNFSMPQAFALADDILLNATKSIAEMITCNMYVNVDFHDVYNVMSKSVTALMGAGISDEEDRAEKAITAAASSVLLNDENIQGAQKCLLSINYSNAHPITMDELDTIANFVNQNITNNQEATIIWGTGIDDKLDKSLKVTLVATSFNSNNAPANPATVNDSQTESVTIPLQTTDKKEEPVELQHSDPLDFKINQTESYAGGYNDPLQNTSTANNPQYVRQSSQINTQQPIYPTYQQPQTQPTQNIYTQPADTSTIGQPSAQTAFGMDPFNMGFNTPATDSYNGNNNSAVQTQQYPNPAQQQYTNPAQQQYTNPVQQQYTNPAQPFSTNQSYDWEAARLANVSTPQNNGYQQQATQTERQTIIPATPVEDYNPINYENLPSAPDRPITQGSTEIKIDLYDNEITAQSGFDVQKNETKNNWSDSSWMGQETNNATPATSPKNMTEIQRPTIDSMLPEETRRINAGNNPEIENGIPMNDWQKRIKGLINSLQSSDKGSVTFGQMTTEQLRKGELFAAPHSSESEVSSMTINEYGQYVENPRVYTKCD